MKKDNPGPNLFETSQLKHKNSQTNKAKTTDINILLNRVRINKQIEIKKRAIFSMLLLLLISSVGFFFLFLQ